MKNFNSDTPLYVSASFWDRSIAAFLDIVIIITLSAPLSLIFSISEVLFLQLTGLSEVPFYFRAATILLNMLFGVVYYGFFYQTRGTSLGKSIMNMKVVVLPFSDTPNMRTAFQRDILGKLISTLPFFLGYFLYFFRKDRRTLHDLMSKTVVLKRVH